MAIEPKNETGPEKDGRRFARLSEEDPTFKVSRTKTPVRQSSPHGRTASGNPIRDRMFREFKVDANAGKPQIAYRETITTPADGEGKLIKQSGGAANTAMSSSRRIRMSVAKAITIENKVVGGNIPRNTSGCRRASKSRAQWRRRRLPG